LFGASVSVLGHPDRGCPSRGCPHLVHFGAFRPGVTLGDTSTRAFLPAGDD
jgi:hypothetical protein